MVGSADPTEIRCTPLPIEKLIVSAPAVALASWIAALSVQTPADVAQSPLPGAASEESAALLTVNVALTAGPATKTTMAAASSNGFLDAMDTPHPLRAQQAIELPASARQSRGESSDERVETLNVVRTYGLPVP